MAITLLFKKYFLAVLLCLTCYQWAIAQNDADAIMIPKNYFCSGSMFSNSSWNSYWEGTFKRTNGNIGTLNSNTEAINFWIWQEQVTMSRLYGAIHFRSDCEVALVTGKKVGEFAIQRAKADGAED